VVANYVIELVLLQLLRWCCVDCVIHHERDVREEQKYVCVERASNGKRDCDVEELPILTCERLNVPTSVREERLRRMVSIVACCHSAKLCAHAARDFRSQQYHRSKSSHCAKKLGECCAICLGRSLSFHQAYFCCMY